MNRAAKFAASHALLRAAADIADHWVQSDHCAQAKGATDNIPVILTDPATGEVLKTTGTRGGRRTCAWHHLTYTATQGLVLVADSRAVGIRLHPGAVAALVSSGATHYIADRRVPGACWSPWRRPPARSASTGWPTTE